MYHGNRAVAENPIRGSSFGRFADLKSLESAPFLHMVYQSHWVTIFHVDGVQPGPPPPGFTCDVPTPVA